MRSRSAAVLGLLFAAAAFAEQPRLLILDLNAVAGASKDHAKVLNEVMADTLGRTGLFQVTAASEMQTLIGVERQRQLAGCGEEAASCLAELAGALGARFVLSGTLAKLGDSYQLTLQTLDTQKGQPIGRATRIARDLETLQLALPHALAEATATPAPPEPNRLPQYALMGVGGASALAGGLVLFDSVTREATYQAELEDGAEDPTRLRPLARYEELAKGISSQRLLGTGLAVAGAALVGAGVLLMPKTAVAPRVALTLNLDGISIAGEWQ